MTEFVIETALLTHGLSSVSNDRLLELWPWKEPRLVWLEGGRLRRGTLEEFLPIRDRCKTVRRVNRAGYRQARAQGDDAALTASATMEAAMDLSIPVAVTGGMSGIGDIAGEELCPDLPALAELPIVLVATAPKDVIDIGATIKWLIVHGVKVLGKQGDICTGFLLDNQKIPLSGAWQGQPVSPQTLLLQGIPAADRLKDAGIIREARKAGKAAQERGEAYHPAANAAIDRLSKGRSSLLQLASLIANGKLAGSLTLGEEVR